MLNKKHTLIIPLLLMLIIVMSGISSAMPAAPRTHLLSQPDGTVINARLWGDKWSHGWETDDGYTIVLEKNALKWHYASHDGRGKLAASLKIVGQVTDLKNIKKHLRPTGLARVKSQSVAASSTASLPAGLPPLTGASNIPVILINFSNTSTSYTPANFNTLLFGTGSKSMKDYYEEVSYGAFSISSGPSGIAGWYTASNTHNYYGQNDAIGQDRWPGTLVREAIAAADSTFDFAPYDQDGDCYVDVVNLVHQGSGEEAGGPSTDIWSHRWNLSSAYYYGYSNGSVYTTNDNCPQGGNIKINDYVIQPEILWGNIQTMGVFAHEYGHSLGLPDLYDTDGSSEGIGNWGLMGAGSWNYVTRSGDTPAHMSAWSKVTLGWVNPVQVLQTLTDEPIDQAAATPDIYQFTTSNPSEYFLVENRNRSGFDAGLPGSGLAIWHIDNSKLNNKEECNFTSDCTSAHYKVALVQADGSWHLENNVNRGNATDMWYLGNAVTFDTSSSPNSNLYNGTPTKISVTGISTSGSTMTATLSKGLPVPGTVTPSNTQFNTFVDSPFDLTTNFSDNDSNMTSCEYCKSIDGNCDTEWAAAILTGSSPTWTCTQTGITASNGDLLTLNMRSTSGDGTGVGSAVIRTVDSAVPADGIISPTSGDTQIDLSWTGFSDSGSGLNSSDTYKLVYSTTGPPNAYCTDGTEITAVTTGTIYQHTGLTNGLTYYYRICAIDAVSNISSGSNASVTLPIRYQLTTSVSPPGSGSIVPDYSGGQMFDSGTLVVLSASETSGYPFIDWTGCDSASANICTMTMDSDKDLTAAFDATCMLPVRNMRISTYYSTLQDAYNATVDGDTIQSRITILNNDVNADRNILVTFDGGYNCDYSYITGTTVYNGIMTISSGTVTIGNYIFGN